jgi:hypothetical protein
MERHERAEMLAVLREIREQLEQQNELLRLLTTPVVMMPHVEAPA